MPTPSPDPAVALPTIAAAILALLATLGCPPVEVGLTTFLAGLLALVASLWATEGRRLPEAAALRSARRAALLGEEPHVTAARVRGVELGGRAGRCRDAAMRCLVEAGKCRRLEERLRREAARWLGRALDEIFMDVR